MPAEPVRQIHSLIGSFQHPLGGQPGKLISHRIGLTMSRTAYDHHIMTARKKLAAKQIKLLRSTRQTMKKDKHLLCGLIVQISPGMALRGECRRN